MESYRSGTTTERIVRTAILTAVLLVYSAWSFRDGYYKWPVEKNLPIMIQHLPVPKPADPKLINPAVTKAALDAIEKGSPIADVDSRLGEPVDRKPDATSDTRYYFGPGGVARVVVRNDKVQLTEWIDQGLKTEFDLRLQKIIGAVTGVLGLLMLLQFIRVLTTRVELTEAGLRVNSQGGQRFGGSPLVPLEAMTGLKTVDYDRKGWVEVEYKLPDGRQGSVSLNDYVHRAFPQIVQALCEHHGWQNPIKARREAKAAEAAATAPDGEPGQSEQPPVTRQSGE